jgi:hypothetical protein
MVKSLKMIGLYGLRDTGCVNFRALVVDAACARAIAPGGVHGSGHSNV